MENIKTCFLITSYCENIDKTNILLDTIKKVKDNFDIEILLHSNRVPLDKNIISSVDHFIYDSRYLIDHTKRINCWQSLTIQDGRLITMNVVHSGDIGFAVKESINNSLGYLNSLGFENVIIINYDTTIDEKLIKLIIEFNKNKISGLLFERQRIQEELNPLILMLNIKKSLEVFNIPLGEYQKYKVYEHFLYSKFANREDVYIMEDWGISHESSKIEDFDSSGVVETEYLNIFFYVEDGVLSFLVYDILEFNFEKQIKIEIENLDISFFVDEKINFNETKLFRTNYNMEDDKKIIITLNGKKYYFNLQPGRNSLTIANN